MLIPREPRAQGFDERDAGEVILARNAIEPGCEPLIEGCGERGVVDGRPGTRIGSVFAHELHAGLQIACVARPVECIDAELACANEHRGARGLHRNLGKRLLLQYRCVETNDATRDHGLIA